MIKGSFEYTKLKKAVLMLLDWTYGESRIKKVREALERFPAHTSFPKSLFPLNAILDVARQDYAAAEQLVDLCERRRVWLHKKEEKLTPSLLRVRSARANNTKLYRERIFKTIEAFEIHAGRKLTKEEAEAVVAWRKHIWAKAGEQISKDYPHLVYQKVKKLVAEKAQDNAEKLLAGAKIKPDRKFFDFAVKTGKNILKKKQL